MSREIKFRGQTRRKGEFIINMGRDKCDANWVHGGIFPQNNGGDFAIIYEQPSCEKRVVYADTVGQYTGKKDKKENEIYEDDIVLCDDGKVRQVQWFEEYAAFMIWCITDNKVHFLYDNDFLKIEVIGNVYENADLLKEVDR